MPSREHEVESIFSVGNGHLGSRGSLAEGSDLSAPATFVAGVFASPPGSSMLELAAGPDWAHVEAAIQGAPLSMSHGDTLEHRRVLDMRQGVLWREWRHRDEAGRITRIRGLRFASLDDRHLLGQSIAVTAENYGGVIGVKASAPPFAEQTHGPIRVAFAAQSMLETPDSFAHVPMTFEAQLALGQTIRLDRAFDVEITLTQRRRRPPPIGARPRAAGHGARAPRNGGVRPATARPGRRPGGDRTCASRAIQTRSGRCASRSTTWSAQPTPTTNACRSARAP